MNVIDSYIKSEAAFAEAFGIDTPMLAIEDNRELYWHIKNFDTKANVLCYGATVHALLSETGSYYEAPLSTAAPNVIYTHAECTLICVRMSNGDNVLLILSDANRVQS